MHEKDGPPAVGLVGAGSWGANYLRLIPELARFSGVCDLSAEVRHRVRDRSPGVPVFSSFSELLASDTDAVIVATPPELHAQHALLAIRAGKHVLVEKPLATSAADAEKIFDASIQRGVCLMVGHHLLFHPVVVRLLEIVEGGELGEVREVNALRTSSGAARASGSALWSLAPHDVALALRLWGRMPDRIEVSPGKGSAGEELRLGLWFEGGARATLDLSRRAASRSRRVHVRGSRGWAMIDEITGRLTVSISQGRTEIVDTSSSADPLTLQYAEFVRRIRGASADAAGARLALDVVRVLSLAERTIDVAAPDSAPFRRALG